MSVQIDHVNISVQNLEESVQWYQELFGFHLVEQGVNQHGTKWAILAYEDSMIAMSEHPQRERGDQIDETKHAIFHFGLRVPDREAWRKLIENKQLKLYYGGEVQYPHSISWYIHDPSGHEIEVSWTDGHPLPFPE